MIRTGTVIRVLDNSGAKWGQCIRILRNKNSGKVGDKIIISIKKCLPHKKVRTHQIHKALIVRNNQNSRRKDGSYIKWSKGACVLVNKQNQPLGKRILGPVNKDLRIQGHLKIISISSIAL